MTDEEYEFILQDRIAKIQAINEQYDLENTSYIAFSGGKDSTMLHYLIDIALQNNHIPRVFSNTGIEYIAIVQYVKELAKNDPRIIIVNQDLNIKKTLDKYGYPFKSKEHSQKIQEAKRSWEKNGCLPSYLLRYVNGENHYKNTKGEEKTSILTCPEKLRYQFEEGYKSNISKMCCDKLKKRLSLKWQESNPSRIMTITGMRKEEGGARFKLTCLSRNNKKFNPLSVINDEFEDEFFKRNNIKLCKLYYPPYNFKRTGCKGCPYALNIQETLQKLYKYLPNEYWQCLHLWKPVYDEYIKIGYRLKCYPHEVGIQLTLDDFLDEKER